jgi:hypothetical protein
MKLEVQFVGGSIDADTYEGEHIDWNTHEGQITIYVGTKEEADRVATYPADRVVRVKVVE